VLPDGQTATNQCGGAGAWQPQWATDVLATRPDVVFVMAAARDVYDVAEPDGTILHPGVVVDPVMRADGVHFTRGRCRSARAEDRDRAPACGQGSECSARKRAATSVGSRASRLTASDMPL
jgi:hypothetical protein